MNTKKLLLIGLILATAVNAACQQSFAKFSSSLANRTTASSPSAAAPASRIVDKEYEDYRQQIVQRFLKKDYAWIDQEAHRVRVSKERLPGGYWKLRALYAAMEEPSLGDKASDGDWEDLLQNLADWAHSKPNSVTAEVALATAWKGYAWKARGNGYADKVNDAAWEVFGKRLDKAQQALSDAIKLKEECPFWFVTAMWVGIGQQWNRQSLEKIFDAGFKLEPTFYYIQQTKATYLLPRWGGEEGEWERFADESALKIGGHQGDIVFFAIYSQMLALHGLELMNNHQKAAPKLLAGFRSIEKLYGASAHRLNEACLFSVFSGDTQTTSELFARIGNDPDVNVWRSKQNFEIFRQGIEQRAKAAQAQPQSSGPVSPQPKK